MLGYILGFIWCSPMSALVWAYMLVLLAFGSMENVRFLPNLAIIWDVENDSWLYTKMHGRGWYGVTLGNNMIVNDIGEGYETSIKHENVHIVQNYIWGVFFLPVYVLVMGYMYLFMHDKHSYIDHPFEREARMEAGQKVDYTRAEWPDGPNDRGAWF